MSSRPIALVWLVAGLASLPVGAQQPRPHGRLFPPQDLGLLEAPDRDRWQRPDRIMDALGIADASRVADIGAGSGWFTIRLARRVGPQGVVYAQDVFPDFVESAKKSASGLTNIRYVLGNARSAELPAASQDVILVLDAYHHFDYPAPMLASLLAALKPEGRLVIVEYHKNDKAMPNGRALQHIRLSREEFVKEIESHGLKALEVKDFIPEVQWMGVFMRR